MIRFAKLIATFFGLGYAPFAPGTFGALGGFGISYVLIYGTILPYAQIQLLHGFLIVLTYFAGVYACKVLQPHWGNDPSRVVIDEALGFWVSFFALPFTLFYLVGALLLFRIFDIAKPFGIRRIDRWHTPHAVMLDDVAAGICANLVLQAVRFLVESGILSA